MIVMAVESMGCYNAVFLCFISGTRWSLDISMKVHDCLIILNIVNKHWVTGESRDERKLIARKDMPECVSKGPRIGCLGKALHPGERHILGRAGSYSRGDMCAELILLSVSCFNEFLFFYES